MGIRLAVACRSKPVVFACASPIYTRYRYEFDIDDLTMDELEALGYRIVERIKLLHARYPRRNDAVPSWCQSVFRITQTWAPDRQADEVQSKDSAP